MEKDTDRLQDPIPKFATEAEEADWWYDNRDKLAAEFAARIKEGRVQHGRASMSTVFKVSKD